MICRFLGIDRAAWLGLEETAGSSAAKHHVGAVGLSVSSTFGDTKYQYKISSDISSAS